MKPYYYSSIPFVRLLIPLLLGRIISFYTDVSSWIYYFSFSVLISALIFVWYSPKLGYSKRYLSGMFISITLFFIGVSSSPNYLFSSQLFGESSIYQARVDKVLKTSSNKQNLVLTCISNNSSSEYYFKSVAYIKNDSSSSEILPGDVIVFKSKLNELKITGNPYAFEYSQYLINRGIRGTFFLDSDCCIKSHSLLSFQRYFYLVRKSAEKKLKQIHLEDDVFGIVSALVLGNKSMLDYQIKANFSYSGAIHILSVSGLHVGIIYLLLITILGKIRRGFWATIKVVIIIVVLWYYAALAGMSPSVFRATIMFSIFLISKRINQQYNIYHSLAIAAFVILIIDPYSVIHAGFWLSFFAVASIVYFYPKIHDIFYFSTPWGKFLWSLISVSFAAQIGTVPLTIYLFGFFPTWFFVSNILIIPILPFILIGAVLVINLPVDFIIVRLIGDPIVSMLIYLKEVTDWIANLSFSRFTDLQFQFYQVLLLYTGLVLFVSWQQLKYGKYLFYSMLFIFLGILGIGVESFVKNDQEMFVVHQARNNTVISHTSKSQCFCLVGEELKNKEECQFVIPLMLTQESKYLNQNQLDSVPYYPVQLKNKRILILNENTKSEDVIRDADVLVFTSKVCFKSIRSNVSKFKEKEIVFDSSFSISKSKFLKKELLERKIAAHFVSLDGAFTLTL